VKETKTYTYTFTARQMPCNIMIQLASVWSGDPDIYRPTLWEVDHDYYADEDAINIGTGVYLTNGYSVVPIVPQGVKVERVGDLSDIEHYEDSPGECQIDDRTLFIMADNSLLPADLVAEQEAAQADLFRQFRENRSLRDHGCENLDV
jgi:hypothetical protein